ncbi:MAG: acyl carrier protein [Magnetococcales bacterium]|nr:acyl carrier protein [Magnetococcales bacterium]
MNHSAHDARIFKVLAGVLAIPVEQVARLAVTQETSDAQQWDSLQHINIILGLEAEFGVRFDLLEAIDLKTIPLIRARLATLPA